jgi:hypothetical protein
MVALVAGQLVKVPAHIAKMASDDLPKFEAAIATLTGKAAT